MGGFILKTKSKKNQGLVMSPSELMAIYFYGVNILSKDGSKLSTETIELYIRSAQEELEKHFGLKLLPTLISESADYFRDEYHNSFPHFSVSYLVNKPLSLTGLLGTVKQIEYPPEWLVSKRSSEGNYSRTISLVPTGSASVLSGDVILSGVLTQIGIRRFPIIPTYWDIQYLTGFSVVPSDLVNLIGMLAAIPLLGIAGDLILGAGIASQSLSVDGLSQSISSTSSATNSGYGARILQYEKNIKSTMGRLGKYYKKMRFTSL